MSRIRLLSLILAAAAGIQAAAIPPQAAAGAFSARDSLPTTVELVALGDTEFASGGGAFLGPLEVVAAGRGLGLVETQPLEAYLTGLREVPASWPAAALEAQAVAGRTYLAWSLERSRAGGARSFGYDICATTACQVYRGSAVATDAAAAPWVEAVDHTSGEILVFDGAPAHTFYSASAGKRTRPIQDIWGGGEVPYLVAVDSPEAGITPYEEWVVVLPEDLLVRILARSGIHISDRIDGVALDQPAEGAGRSSVVIAGDGGNSRISVSSFRAIINAYGPDLYPGLLPARRPDGGLWPQAILSYTFDVEWDAGEPTVRDGLAALLPTSDRPRSGSLRIVGEGWGHGVGMSQWGAKAMADGGAGYAEILSHYYGGLEPQQVALPELVRIGLAEDQAAIAIDATGPFEIRANGTLLGTFGAGTWNFRAIGSGVGVVPPDDLVGSVGRLFHRNWPR